MNIETNIIYCDRCHPSALVNGNPPTLNGDYYFTKCGKIFCKTCITTRSECNNCGTNCASKIIDKHMNIEMAIYFRDYQQLSKTLNSVYLFQMKRCRQSIQYLLKANDKMKKSLAERAAIRSRIEEKDREIEQLERQLNELEREQQQQQQNTQLQQQSQQFVKPNDSFMATFMHHVDQQVENPQLATNIDHHHQQQLDFNVDPIVDTGFHHPHHHRHSYQSNLPGTQLSSSRSHSRYISPSIISRGSDKSSTIGLAYPIRRDQHKSQQIPVPPPIPPMPPSLPPIRIQSTSSSQHSSRNNNNLRSTTAYIQTSQWNRSHLSFR
ncbi:hypothetical protein DERP_010909 [Dermatophagoides pteronyssinus]|nr:hypothetical protein DERP_010909 [Dermatophagoides pteronyssinus]